MNKRHLAATCAAIAGCFALSLLVTRLRPFSAQADAQGPSTDAVLGASTINPGEPTDRSPEIYQGSFLYGTTDAMLKALGVTVYPQDKVYAFPDLALGIGSVIKVYRAQPVAITDGNTPSAARTWGATVKDVLAEQNIELGDQDRVVPGLDTLVARGSQPFQIAIIRVAVTQLTLNSDVAFGITYTDDPTLEKGTNVVQSAGVKGVLQKVYQVRRENGVEVSRTLLSSAVTKQPVSQVVRRGTKVVMYGSGLASWYAAPSMTAASTTIARGTKVLVTNTANGKSVTVTIADYGPFVAGRVIDLSKDAFAAIGSVGSGVVSVTLQKAQ